MTSDPADPSEPTSPEGQALQQRRVMHLRWDLDKTYLRTEFDTVKDLIKTFRQKAEDKIAVAGASALLRALLDPRERSHRRVTFISGSPRQMRKVLTAKLALDGIEYDEFVLKNNLKNLLRGRFRALRAQIPYKLPAMLRSRLGAAADAETLFGDDAEADAIIYCLYAGLIAGRVSLADLERVLVAARTYDDDLERILALARDVPKHDAVRRMFIHLDRRSPPLGFGRFGLLGVFGRLGFAAAARAGRAAAVDVHQNALDVHARGADVHEPTGAFERELHAGLDDHLHPGLDVDLVHGA